MWYKVVTNRLHYSAGTRLDRAVYIESKNIIAAMNRFRKLPAVDRNMKGAQFPGIYPLNETESKDLEKRIAQSKRVSLFKARQTYFME